MSNTQTVINKLIKTVINKMRNNYKDIRMLKMLEIY